MVLRIPWYTAGYRPVSPPYKYIWEGYPPELQNFNTDLLSLLVDKPDQRNMQAWDTNRVKVSYIYNNMTWRFNLTTKDEDKYFICETSKSIISKVVTMVRTADFGQNDLSNIKRGPCITQQPVDQM